jgi:hypothetical protein
MAIAAQPSDEREVRQDLQREHGEQREQGQCDAQRVLDDQHRDELPEHRGPAQHDQPLEVDRRAVARRWTEAREEHGGHSPTR